MMCLDDSVVIVVCVCESWMKTLVFFICLDGKLGSIELFQEVNEIVPFTLTVYMAI